MTFIVACPSCKSRLVAKPELVGKTRPCPKCKTPVHIVEPPPEPPVPLAASTGATVTSDEPLPSPPESAIPTKLDFRSRYFICGADSVLATWQHQEGWQVGVGNGFASARRNAATIPDQGVFAFVELVVAPTDSGMSPRGMRFFGITKRGGISAIGRGDDEILNDLNAPVALTRPQRVALLEHLRRATMYTFWEGANELLDFLANPANPNATSVWVSEREA
ncbi:MAG: hypothetical protein ACRC46_06475 [Thermoguttaceae bacterium]